MLWVETSKMGNKSSKVRAKKNQHTGNSESHLVIQSTGQQHEHEQRPPQLQNKTQPSLRESHTLAEAEGDANGDAENAMDDEVEDEVQGYINKPDSHVNPAIPYRGSQSKQTERCRRCDSIYFPAHLTNPFRNTTCGRYHPGRVTARARVVKERGPISRTSRSEQMVWDCCFLACEYDERGMLARAGNGCTVYSGNHEPRSVSTRP